MDSQRTSAILCRQKDLHDKILNLRNQIYAHSDGDKYEVKPGIDNGYDFSTFLAPPSMITRNELIQLNAMINKMLKKFMKVLS